MPIQISTHLGISEEKLEELGVLNAVIGLDMRLFVDPFSFEGLETLEFKEARENLKKYYNQIRVLLTASRSKGDRAWNEAVKRLTFKEVPGVSIGYGTKSGDGNGVGRILASKLAASASEIISLGFEEPEIFELLGLFEDDFGPDRISDMSIKILQESFYAYTERICRELKVAKIKKVDFNGKSYNMPLHPYRDEPIVFLPQQVLKELPIAFSFDDISRVVQYNEALRKKINTLVGADWKEKVKKSTVKRRILKDPEFFKELLTAYKSSKPERYDFDTDPASESSSFNVGREFALNNMIPLSLPKKFTIDDVEVVVKKITEQFQKNIEFNGQNINLFVKKKPRHERHAQVAYFATADAYCSANNLDLSREPSAGRGPVDFKVSAGATEKVLVEIKLSSNTSLVKGYLKQLPIYERSENTKNSFYVILRVTEAANQIEQVVNLEKASLEAGKIAPKVIVIDARLKPSASKS